VVTVARAQAESLPTFVTDFARAGVVSPAAIAKTALRYECTGVEDLLAHIASDGTMRVEDIADAARAVASGQPSDNTVEAKLTAPAVYALAQLTIGTDITAVDPAADLFALAGKLARRDGARLEHGNLALQTNLAAGRLEHVRQHLHDAGVDRWVRWAAATDLIHPSTSPESSVNWLAALNKPFVSRGIAPVSFVEPSKPAFDTVHTEAPQARAGTVDGPQISVVMPVFKPSLSLITAVGSLLKQTWRNVEVIVVDDASPEEYEPIFAQVRALDDRVTYLRMPTNGGAYRARNHGITHATSEFVGIQDGDDWSHPERIERQMREFARRPELVATLSKAIRLYSDLRITKLGSFPYEKNAPSLIFRRELVTSRLGRFDDIRKAADTEFIERLTAVFGSAAVHTLDEPLSLYQLTDGSLSRADFRIGWHRDARVSYHSSFRHWHRSIVDDGADPFISADSPRAFPVPPEFEGTSYPSEPPDVVLLADWRGGLLGSVGLDVLVRGLAGVGLRVGLARAEALRNATVARGYADPSIQQVLAEGLAMWTPPGADLAPRVLFIRDPDLLSFPRRPSSVLMRPERVVIVADHAPRSDADPRISFDPAHIERVVRELFECEPEWLPATTEISTALVAAGASGTRHEAQVAEVVAVSRFTARPNVGRPVIGVWNASPFAAERIPPARLLSTLPTDPGYDVRILDSSSKLPGRDSHTWLRFAPQTTSADEFFDQCDFVVALPPRVAGVSFLRPVVTAMARGCVPVVPETLGAALGDPATYSHEHTVAEVIDGLWNDPERFVERQRASLAACEQELSAEALVSAIGRRHTT
jgi:hypothetical protein